AQSAKSDASVITPKPPSNLDFIPDQIDEKILILLFIKPQPIYSYIISKEIALPHEQETLFHLNRLVKHGYIYKPPTHPISARRSVGYRLSDKGREYAIRNDLVENATNSSQKPDKISSLNPELK